MFGKKLKNIYCQEWVRVSRKLNHLLHVSKEIRKKIFIVKNGVATLEKWIIYCMFQKKLMIDSRKMNGLLHVSKKKYLLSRMGFEIIYCISQKKYCCQEWDSETSIAGLNHLLHDSKKYCQEWD